MAHQVKTKINNYFIISSTSAGDKDGPIGVPLSYYYNYTAEVKDAIGEIFSEIHN